MITTTESVAAMRDAFMDIQHGFSMQSITHSSSFALFATY
jgi:hypothetical protein